MGEIKSSWEIAWEKAGKLGELSQEERRKQKEDRCRPIGNSLVDKYLGEQDAQDLEAELKKYDSEDREFIAQVALRRLIELMDLKSGFALDRINNGILSLDKTEKTVKIMDRIKELYQQYYEAEAVERREIEEAGREMLHQQRISGTAISRINIQARETWQKKLERIALPFEKSLDGVKQELLE